MVYTKDGALGLPFSNVKAAFSFASSRRPSCLRERSLVHPRRAVRRAANRAAAAQADAEAVKAGRLPSFKGCASSPATVRPTHFLFECDGGEFLSRLHWSGWTTRSANAVGVWHQGHCSPGCEGFRAFPHVAIRLSDPETCAGGYLFTRLTLEFEGYKPAVLPHRRFNWPAPFVLHRGCPLARPLMSY